MTINHFDVSSVNVKSTHYCTKTPSSKTLDAARKTLLHAVNYHGCGQLAHYQGPPSATYSGQNTNDFYIIFPSVDPPGSDNKINIGADLLCWSRATAGITVAWDDGDTDTYAVASGGTQDGTSLPSGARIFSTNEVASNLNSVTDGSAGYGYTKLSVNNCCLAYLSAYTIQRRTANYRADSAAAGSFDQQFVLKNDAFNIGTPLIGTNDWDFAGGSIGALCQHQNARDAVTASMVSSTAPCVFQYAHPAGIYVNGIGGWVSIFGKGVVNSDTIQTTLRLRGRELIATNPAAGGVAAYSKPLDLAVVARWSDGAGAAIRVTTWTTSGALIEQSVHTLPAGGGDVNTPTLTVVEDVVNYYPRGCNVGIDAYATTSGDVEIQSVALFERSMGDAV